MYEEKEIVKEKSKIYRLKVEYRTMKKFNYVIKDEIGIHARPAGMLVKASQKYKSKILVKKNGKTAEIRKLMALMGLGIKCGDEIEVSVDGEDEELAFAEIKAFFENNL